MPSTRHELLVALVRDTAAGLLPLVVPAEQAGATWWDQNANLTLPNPVERRADMLLLDDPVQPTYGVIVEVQLQWDDKKRFTFPLYQMAARDRYLCPIQPVLVTPSAAVAAKFATPVHLGGGIMWQPSIFGPDEAWAFLTGHASDAVSPDLLLLLAGVAGSRDDGRIARALFSAAGRSQSRQTRHASTQNKLPRGHQRPLTRLEAASTLDGTGLCDRPVFCRSGRGLGGGARLH